MKNKFKNSILGLLATIAFIGITQAATTKFNYQGEIIYNGSPANGTFFVRFNLYDSLVGGGILHDISGNYDIENGLLNAELDFLDNEFLGADRWIEILIQEPNLTSEGMGGGTFFTLSPRVPINTAPYAIQANFVANDSINSSSVENGSLIGLDFEDLTIAGNKIANFQITNVKIENNTIGFEKFATNGASDGNIIQYNSTSGEWESATLASNSTPWTTTTNGILYPGNVGISIGSSFTPDAPLDIRGILNNPIFKVNLDGSIQRTLQTRILTLGYQAFTPEKSSFKYEINSSGTIAGISNVETSSNNVKLYAPILLPHGATITKFELLAFDDDPSEQVSASLKLTSFSTNNVSSTLSTLSTGVVPTPGGIIVSSGLLNQNYFTTNVFYAFITIDKPGIPGTDLIFSGVKITYEIETL